jgi:hypothetical protein
MEIVISENRESNGEKAALHGADLIAKPLLKKRSQHYSGYGRITV